MSDNIIKYTIVGKVVDDSLSPISEAIIRQSPTLFVFTDSTGDFTLTGEYDKNEIFTLNVSSPLYNQLQITPFNSDNTLKSNVGIIQLTSINKDLTESIQKEINLSPPQLKLLKASKTNFETLQQQALNNVVTQLKTTLLPIVLTEIAKFGISRASDIVNNPKINYAVVCPLNLDQIINNKNRLVKQLTNLYKVLDTVKVNVDRVTEVLVVSEIIANTLKAILSPTPPAVPSLIDVIESQIKKYRLISSVTSVILVILIELLRKILQYLALLDELVLKCATEQNIPQEKITQELTNLTAAQAEEFPIITNINGFTFSVETEKTNNSLKRRRALAQNNKGIIMLKGEWSFSSNDQILIDELIFYIQQNNLKAD